MKPREVHIPEDEPDTQDLMEAGWLQAQHSEAWIAAQQATKDETHEDE
jgi:hypothetical protein